LRVLAPCLEDDPRAERFYTRAREIAARLGEAATACAANPDQRAYLKKWPLDKQQRFLSAAPHTEQGQVTVRRSKRRKHVVPEVSDHTRRTAMSKREKRRVVLGADPDAVKPRSIVWQSNMDCCLEFGTLVMAVTRGLLGAAGPPQQGRLGGFRYRGCEFLFGPGCTYSQVANFVARHGVGGRWFYEIDMKAFDSCIKPQHYDAYLAFCHAFRRHALFSRFEEIVATTRQANIDVMRKTERWCRITGVWDKTMSGDSDTTLKNTLHTGLSVLAIAVETGQHVAVVTCGDDVIIVGPRGFDWHGALTQYGFRPKVGSTPDLRCATFLSRVFVRCVRGWTLVPKFARWTKLGWTHHVVAPRKAGAWMAAVVAGARKSCYNSALHLAFLRANTYEGVRPMAIPTERWDGCEDSTEDVVLDGGLVDLAVHYHVSVPELRLLVARLDALGPCKGPMLVRDPLVEHMLRWDDLDAPERLAEGD
jgi:hypothetical protein